jgi:F-box protein 45
MKFSIVCKSAKKWYHILESCSSTLWRHHKLKTVPSEALQSDLLSSLSSHNSRLKAFKYVWNPNECSSHNYVNLDGFVLKVTPYLDIDIGFPLADSHRRLELD